MPTDNRNTAKLVAKIGAGALALAMPVVAYYEGYRATVYSDPIGRSAVCYGHDDPTLKLGTTYTLAQCQQMLADDLLKHAAAFDCIKPPLPLSDSQKAAILSLAFNIGVPRFCGSTFARRITAGELPQACEELSKFIFAGGKILPGLQRRRAAERQMCESVS
ncbi:MAG: lysozyme [Burkholderiaceae bacterium]